MALAALRVLALSCLYQKFLALGNLFVISHSISRLVQTNNLYLPPRCHKVNS